jgi:hypothetical protein
MTLPATVTARRLPLRSIVMGWSVQGNFTALVMIGHCESFSDCFLRASHRVDVRHYGYSLTQPADQSV